MSYYDPTTAQFLTPDPLFAITGSRYGYAGNDPINKWDPLGLVCGNIMDPGYNPACLTLYGYAQNCTGNECIGHTCAAGSLRPLSGVSDCLPWDKNWTRLNPNCGPFGVGPCSEPCPPPAAREHDRSGGRGLDGDRIVNDAANVATVVKKSATATASCSAGAFYGGSISVWLGPEVVPFGVVLGCGISGALGWVFG